MLSGKCKLKTTMRYYNTATEWPKSRILTTPNVNEDVEQPELSYIVGVNTNCTTTLEDSLSASYKTNIFL